MLKVKEILSYKILIIGAGSSALTLASKLVKEGENDIGIYSLAHGASPEIAGINFLTEDTIEERELYVEDMLRSGYRLNEIEHVKRMVGESFETLGFMEEIGVEFDKDGRTYKKRHLSGHSKPRTLYNSKEFIGTNILKKQRNYLKDAGVNVNLRHECIDVREVNGRKSALFIKDGELIEIYADIIVLAWGGAGSLLGQSTYPKDVYGRTLSIADKLGLELVDLEFIEYEPMVMLYPEKVKGEPCPTAMLGEGAYLLNSKEERFLLEVLDTEAGAPKSIINREIQKQVDIGNGSQYGGVWADLRHIPAETLKGYPWFYNLLIRHGVDPNKELLNVGPMKHSLSGGIKVDVNYRAKEGFYAIGEAAGGIHGACRSAGNGGAQAVISGYIAAKAILHDVQGENRKEIIEPSAVKINDDIFNKYKDKLAELGDRVFQYVKVSEDLEAALEELNKLLKDEEIEKDIKAYQAVNAAKLIIKSSIKRKNSIGSFIIK